MGFESYQSDILFWNCEGFFNINVCNVKNFPLLICLCETWETAPLSGNRLPPFLRNYNSVCAPAIKEKSRGRASGGLLMLIDSKLVYKVIDVSNLWICCLINLEDVCIVFILVYFKPDNDIKPVLSSLQELLFDLSAYDNIMIGGDFNCRVGMEGNCYSDEYFEGTNLSGERLSGDKTCNYRGKRLLEFMFENSFVLLNGRCDSDRPAQFTFVGSQGCSVIDHVWVRDKSLNIIKDLYVSDNVSHSSHLQVVLRLQSRTGYDHFNYVGSTEHDEILQRLRWDGDKEFDYTRAMLVSNRISLPLKVDDVHQNLSSAIFEVASSLSISSCPTKNASSHMYRQKPWFDRECRSARRITRQALRRFRLRVMT